MVPPEVKEEPTKAEKKEFFPPTYGKPRDVTAQVEEITRSGRVKVVFNELMRGVDDCKREINSDVLDVQFRQNRFFDESNDVTGFTWVCDSFGNNTMWLNLTFDDPLYVSQGMHSDLLDITFLQRSMFVSKNGNWPIIKHW